MKPITLSVSLLLTLAMTGSVIQADNPNSSANATPVEQLTTMTLAFTQNIGQWPDSILFRASAGEATMWFTRDGIYYQYSHPVQSPELLNAVDAASPPSHEGKHPDFTGRLGYERDSIETIMIKAEFVGANPDVEVISLDELDYKCNYFIGNDPNKWFTDVPSYSGFMLKGLYPGVDVSFQGKDGRMEYEIASSDSSALAQVQVDYRGAEGVAEQADGTVLVRTVLGEKRFAGVLPAESNPAPVFNASTNSLSPAGATLTYSTYLGDGSDDLGNDIAVDLTGSAYVTGYTLSLDGGWDVFVTKLSPAGNNLVYSTYLGGGGDDRGFGIAVDLAECAYVIGYTGSSDFPTASPFDGSYGDGGADAFVTKLSPAGSSLIYSTYLGGTDADYGRGIAVDLARSAYVTGFTHSTDFPIANPFGGSLSGDFDAFVTRLSPAGNNLVSGRYLGGTGCEYGYGIAVDSAGSAYVTGYTASSDFPTTSPFDASFSGTSDAFVTKLSPASNSLVYSTYLGGSSSEYGRGIAVDLAGIAYVTGYTASSDFPTVSPFDGSYGGDSNDGFVTKLSPAGNSLIYSTYLGGSSPDYGIDIAVDLTGSVYLTGYTCSSDFPIASPFDDSYGGGYFGADVFVTKLSTAGNSLIYSTYLGGGGDDYGYGIAVDSAGSAHVTGNTGSSDFPTASPFDGSLSGDFDAFVTKLTEFDCCIGLTGNVDGDIGDIVDMGDLTALIGYLFIPPFEVPTCKEEANTDGTGVVDIGDLTALIGYLFVPPFDPLADCE